MRGQQGGQAQANLVFLAALRPALPFCARELYPTGGMGGYPGSQARTHFAANFWLHLLLRGELSGQLAASLPEGRAHGGQAEYPSDKTPHVAALQEHLEHVVHARVAAFLGSE
eukprot:EST47969.1 Hypothetical protein SS50377_11880 [Spironucleus salmonicida]